MPLPKEQANGILFSLPSIFAYSSPIFAPPRGLTQTVTQTRKRPSSIGRTHWTFHRAESTQKRRKVLQHNAFRRASYLHTQEVTGSSPAVSTKRKPWKPCVSKVFSFLMELLMSACDGRFTALCLQILPCFRSLAVLSCTAFAP